MPITPEQARINGRKGGRKRGLASISAEKAREYVITRVLERMEEIMDTHLDLALGIHEAVLDKDGNVINAYKRLPDAAALRYLKDQVIGKATESVKIEGDVSLKIDV